MNIHTNLWIIGIILKLIKVGLKIDLQLVNEDINIVNYHLL